MLLTSLMETNNLEQAIAYNPLIVTPDTLVTDAIALMSNARATCTLKNISGDTNYLLADARASCVLVMEDKQLVGIFTKRDVVHLSANGRQIGGMVIGAVMTHSVITIQKSDFNDLFAVLDLFRRHRIRHLPILDDDHNLLGLITHENLRQLLRPIDLLQLRLVSEVMNIRVVCTEQETSILDITKLMTKEKVSSVVMIEERNSLSIPIGIITERDIVQFQAMNLNLDCIQVQTVMSSPVFCVSPDESLWSVLMLMQERRIHRIVVTGEQGELLGFMTYTTLLQALNPLDIYNVVQVLEHKVCQLEIEKLELLENRNSQLEAEVKKRTEELQAKTERERLVNAIANRIRTSLELEEILNSLATEVRKVLNCDRVLVYQINANGSGIIIAEDVTSGWLSFRGEEVFDPCFAQNWIEPYVHGRIRIVNDIYTDGMTPCHWELLEYLQIRAKILVPIIVAKNLWGLMLACQNDAPRIWQEEETELLQQLSTHVSIAIQQAELYRRLELELQERKQAEIALSKSEERLRTIVETSASGLVTVDKHGKILFVNPAASGMFGRNISQLQGWPFALPYDCNSHQVQEIEILQPNGQRRKVNMEAATISWNGKNAFLMSLSDITELDELAQANQLKDQFIANMNHELRTPLNAILGMSEGLQEEVFGKLNSQQKRAINTIESSGKHLLELINDILDLSKIEAGKLELQLASVSCSSLCDSSLIFVKQLSLQKNIEISVEVAPNLPEIIVDERRFRQILINLLNNAVKFTHNGGKIRLVVEQVEENKEQEEEEENGKQGEIITNYQLASSQWIRFSVTDNGIGIAEANFDKLFQPFMQIDSSLNRQYNGTGLGLSLVHQLVELHRGKITVTSEIDHGSSFQVDIPYRGEPKIRNYVLPNGTYNQEFRALNTVNYVHKKSASIILFSNDTKVNIITISNYLEAKGYRIILAKNDEECVRLTKTENPSLILIDIPISEIDRIETIKLLRADRQIQHVPIITLHDLTVSSNNSDEEIYQKKYINIGVNEYFTKPVKLKILLDKIQTLVN